jgi:transcriptional regulator with XRE-family HTH domain
MKGRGKFKMDSFNLRLKMLRKGKKKTQQNLADLLKVRRSTYGEYERGKILPPMDKMKVLADYFGVSVDYLIIGNEKQEAELAQEIDVSANLKRALKHLKTDKNLTFEGKELEKESREILISSLENGLKMANIIENEKKNRTT